MSAKVLITPDPVFRERGVNGKLTLVQQGYTVTITGTVSGLNPNSYHGFHVHEKGDITDCKATGPHFNPAKVIKSIIDLQEDFWYHSHLILIGDM